MTGRVELATRALEGVELRQAHAAELTARAGELGDSSDPHDPADVAKALNAAVRAYQARQLASSAEATWRASFPRPVRALARLRRLVGA